MLGLLISNTIGTPEWLEPAVQTEFFIKTGLVILGASLIFMEVLQAGALAFVCIGLETRFVELATTDQRRPALAFIGAQAINVFWTLLLAFLLFGGVIFAQPVIN